MICTTITDGVNIRKRRLYSRKLGVVVFGLVMVVVLLRSRWSHSATTITAGAAATHAQPQAFNGSTDVAKVLVGTFTGVCIALSVFAGRSALSRAPALLAKAFGAFFAVQWLATKYVSGRFASSSEEEGSDDNTLLCVAVHVHALAKAAAAAAHACMRACTLQYCRRRNVLCAHDNAKRQGCNRQTLHSCTRSACTRDVTHHNTHLLLP